MFVWSCHSCHSSPDVYVLHRRTHRRDHERIQPRALRIDGMLLHCLECGFFRSIGMCLPWRFNRCSGASGVNIPQYSRRTEAAFRLAPRVIVGMHIHFVQTCICAAALFLWPRLWGPQRNADDASQCDSFQPGRSGTVMRTPVCILFRTRWCERSGVVRTRECVTVCGMLRSTDVCSFTRMRVPTVYVCFFSLFVVHPASCSKPPIHRYHARTRPTRFLHYAMPPINSPASNSEHFKRARKSDPRVERGRWRLLRIVIT